MHTSPSASHENNPPEKPPRASRRVRYILSAILAICLTLVGSGHQEQTSSKFARAFMVSTSYALGDPCSICWSNGASGCITSLESVKPTCDFGFVDSTGTSGTAPSYPIFYPPTT